MTKDHETRGLTRDTSVNCGTASDLVAAIRNSLAEGETSSALPVQVYVSTNEQSPYQLGILRRAGFKLFDDGLPLQDDTERHLSSLEIFIIEMQLMIHASRFLGWGTTGIHAFIDRARTGRGKNISDISQRHNMK